MFFNQVAIFLTTKSNILKRTASLNSIFNQEHKSDRISHFCTDMNGEQRKWLRDDFDIKAIKSKDITVFNLIDQSNLIGQPFGKLNQSSDQHYKLYSIQVKERLFQMKEVKLCRDQHRDGEWLHYIISSVNQEIHSISRDHEELLKTLTPRETEVLTMVAKGLSMSKIAKNLYLSPHTIDSHRLKLCKKLKVKRTTELAVWAYKFGLLSNTSKVAVH